MEKVKRQWVLFGNMNLLSNNANSFDMLRISPKFSRSPTLTLRLAPHDKYFNYYVYIKFASALDRTGDLQVFA